MGICSMDMASKTRYASRIYFIKEAGTISTEVFYSKVMQTASIELIVVAIGLIIFLIGGVIWFKMWEEGKVMSRQILF